MENPESSCASSHAGLQVRVILVRPEQARNVGAVVRAAANFGAESVRLVGAAGWDAEAEREARVASAGAWELLGGVRLHETLAQAASECEVLAATSARRRANSGPPLTPEEFFGSLEPPKLVGVVFGPESQGLSARDLAQCHVWMQIATSEEFSSLNLAQAVLLVLHESFRRQRLLAKSQEKESPSLVEKQEQPASAGAQEALLSRWEARLGESGALPERVMGQLRRLLWRAEPTVGDLAMLDNMLKRLR